MIEFIYVFLNSFLEKTSRSLDLTYVQTSVYLLVYLPAVIFVILSIILIVQFIKK